MCLPRACAQPLRAVPGRKEVDSDPSPALGCASLTDPERLHVHELIGHSGFLPICLQLLSVSTRLSASLADRRGEYTQVSIFRRVRRPQLSSVA